MTTLTNQLIATSKNEQGDIIVSGRELHEFMEVKTAYKDWFPRMVEYGFSEGSDYVSVVEKVEAQKRARTYKQVDHLMKLDMAKEISMIQRTEKGKLARQYFIEVEKRYKASQPKLPSNYKEALLALVEAEEEKERLEQQIAIQAPKVESFEALMDAKGSQCFSDAAKILQVELEDLMVMMRKKKVLLQVPKDSPAKRYQREGFFVVREGVNRNSKYAFKQTRVTPRGLDFLRKMIEKNPIFF